MRSLRAGILGLACSLIVSASLFAAPAAKGKSTTPDTKPATKFDVASIDIPYKQFKLDNGLTLLVHEDHKAPIVAINIWYHVGSKNEPAGRSGFAHLFEHLMFNGSENNNDDYFQALERIGATDLNGTTNNDRTNYFQNVPTSAVDQVLWLESDRMGHLLGAIDQAKLDEQRGVVQNEKRQYDNQPYAIAEELTTLATYPASHPYSHTVIGSMADLNAAKLEDVKEWFKSYYGPSNAVLVVAGDIDANTALEKVKKYFGDIPSGPPVARFDSWPAKLSEAQTQKAQDRVPQARLIKVWNIPGWATKEDMYLELVADVLGNGKTSRLYKRLVYDDQIATNVAVFLDDREIGGQFHIEVTARPGDDLAKVSKAVDEELTKFLKGGPTQAEVDRVRTQHFAAFLRGIERIGGFGGKSDILASSLVYGGSPDTYKRRLGYVASATPADLHAAAKQWMSSGVYNLEIHPFPQYKAAAQGADRKTMPAVGAPPAPVFPAMEKATLSNGLKVIVARRPSVPVINLNLLVDAGYAADETVAAGTASFAMNMLDEGTKTRDALQISEELANLGATLGTGSDLDTSFVNMSALKTNLDRSLDLFADVLLNPSFPQADFERLQKQQLAGIQREKVNPIQMALRVFPKLLYGHGHAYSNPFSGSGTEASVSKITTADLSKFHVSWVKPNNSTLVVVGDTSLAEVQPKLEKALASWKRGDTPKKNIGTVELAQKPVLYLVDKPDAPQSFILAGHVAAPRNNPNETAIQAMNNLLGGLFTSRVNMNLREGKHWSYGARTILIDARGQRPFIIFAPVQTDKTKESVIEVKKELNDIIGGRPATADEVDKSKSSMTLELPGSWETNRAVAGAISEIVRFGLPDDYWKTFPTSIAKLGIPDVDAAAKSVVHPDSVIWVVVGDREKIEPGLKELGLGDIKLIDADGNPVK